MSTKEEQKDIDLDEQDVSIGDCDATEQKSMFENNKSFVIIHI